MLQVHDPNGKQNKSSFTNGFFKGLWEAGTGLGGLKGQVEMAVDLSKVSYKIVTDKQTQKQLVEGAKGKMNRYHNYSKDKGQIYSKGYETHNSQNSRELGAGNDLQHIKWKDGKSGGHIYYNKPN